MPWSAEFKPVKETYGTLRATLTDDEGNQIGEPQDFTFDLADAEARSKYAAELRERGKKLAEEHNAKSQRQSVIDDALASFSAEVNK